MNLLLTIILIVIGCLIVLYLLAIMPRLGNQSKRKAFYDVYYAHRGLHNNESDAPENSLRAFQKAVDAGYGIELDVQMTKDAIPVVFHDFSLKRICGVEGNVIDYTYDELQQFSLCGTDQTIPKFEDVLKVLDGKVKMIMELKVEKYDLSVCPAVDELLKEYKGMYCMESFNPLAVRWYRKNRPEIVRGQLAGAFHKTEDLHGPLYFVLEHLLMNFITKPDFIAYNHSDYKNLSRQLNRHLYKAMSAAWTIKSQEELDEASKHFDVMIFDSFIPRDML